MDELTMQRIVDLQFESDKLRERNETLAKQLEEKEKEVNDKLLSEQQKLELSKK